MSTNNEQTSSSSTTPKPHFPPGTEVEVSSDEEGFKGAWFRATVVSPATTTTTTSSSADSKRRRKLLVEYRNLVTEDGTEQLTEHVELCHVRPLPPAVGCLSFEVGDVVDADYRDGWWTGVVKKALGNSMFRVFFDNPPDLIEFHQNQMRVHQDWVDSRWLRPKREPQMTGSHFSPGTDVEVNIDSGDSNDFWIPAIVVKENKDNTFLVKYLNTKPKHWGHTVDFLHIRPPAPRYPDRVYKLHEKVDGFHDFAWRSGEITKVLTGKTYVVTFKSDTKPKELSRSDIRPSGEWKGGKWEIKYKEASNTSTSKMAEELEPAPKKSKNAEASPQLENQGAAAVDKPEKRTLQRTSSGRNLAGPSTSKKGEPVSAALAPTPSPNVSEIASKVPSASIGRGRRSKVFKDGFAEPPLSGTTTLEKKDGHIALVNPFLERLTRIRKPVVPFKFETFKKDKRLNSGTTEDKITSPMKRIGRPRKSEVKSLAKPVIGKTKSISTGVVKKWADKKGTKKGVVIPANNASHAGKTKDLPVKLVGKKGTEKEVGLPAIAASHVWRIKDLPTKASSQILEDGLETLTIDPIQSSNDLEEDSDLVVSTPLTDEPILAGLLHSLGFFPNMEHEKPEAGGRRSINKRKRETPQDVAQNVHRETDITLPVQGGTNETPEFETYKRKRADVSSSKGSKNEVSGRQTNSTDDDNRPLSTWISDSPAKNADQRNGNREQEAHAVKASNDGPPEEILKLPFSKKSPVWEVLEVMEIFRVMPQNPHFRPLYKCKEECREGLAIGHMVTFSSLVEKISKLQFEDRDSDFNSTLESLVDLEHQGFNVSPLRDRVNELLSIKDKLTPVCKEAKDIETKIAKQTNNKTKLVAETEDIEKKISELTEKRELIRVQLAIKDLEVERLQQTLNVTYESVGNLQRSFEVLRESSFTL